VISQRKRKRVEEVFGWVKTVGMQREVRFRGPNKVGWMFTFAAAAYNLVRMGNLMRSLSKRLLRLIQGAFGGANSLVSPSSRLTQLLSNRENNRRKGSC
jgi:hypothetical protein